jgi:hypothetical protein
MIAMGDAVTDGYMDGLPLAVASKFGYQIKLNVEIGAFVLNLR